MKGFAEVLGAMKGVCSDKNFENHWLVDCF